MIAMKRLWACAWVIASVIWAGTAWCAEDKTPDKARHDARLDQRISVSTAYDSLEEFCAKLAALTGESGGGDSAEESPGESSSLDETQPRAAVPQQTATPQPPAPQPVGQPSRLSQPIDITCDPAIKDHKVVVRVKEQPLREVMRQIAELFDFTWMQGPQEHPRYHLMQSTARAKLAADLRKRYLAEQTAGYRRIIKSTVGALTTDPAALPDLAAIDPEGVALAALYPDQAQLLLALDDKALDRLLSLGMASLPFTSLPADRRQAVMQDFATHRVRYSDADWQWESAQLRFERTDYDYIHPYRLDITLLVWPRNPEANHAQQCFLGLFCLDSPWLSAADQFVRREDALPSPRPWRVMRDDDLGDRIRALEGDYGINVFEKAREQAEGAVPPWARPKDSPAATKPSGTRVRVKADRTALPLLLLDVAEGLDINLIADCFWTQRDKRGPGEQSGAVPLYPSIKDSDGVYCVDGSPEYTLTRICEQRGYRWVQDGGVFRMRNLLWFVDEPEEVPASVLNEWMRRTQSEKRISLDDYLYLAANLSRRLADNITYTDYRGRGALYSGDDPLRKARSIADDHYDPLKLYSLLTPGLRARAETDGVRLATELPQDLIPQVNAMLTDRRNYMVRSWEQERPEEVAAIYGSLRFWALRRASGASNSEAEVRQCFSVELWDQGQPGPDDEVDDDHVAGALMSWVYPLVVQRVSPAPPVAGPSQSAPE